MYQPKISVIIPVFNACRTIENTLNYLFESSYKDIEVIVIDDCSNDNTVEILKKYPCRIIELQQNKGPAFARNIGAQNCSGDYILFLDADIVIFKDTIEKLIFKIQQINCEAIFSSYTIKNINKSWFSIYHNYFQYFYLIRIFDRLSAMRKLKVFWTACAIVKTEVFNEIGGFYEISEFEDDIFGYELAKRNYTIYMDTNAAVMHDHYYTCASLCKNYYRRSISMVKSLFISKPDDLKDQGYYNISNIGSLIFSYLIIGLGFLSIFGVEKLWLLFFGSVIIYIIFNIKFYTFIYNKSSINFLFFSIFMNFSLYIITGIGIIHGIISVTKNKIIGKIAK